jgi:hypothetical protein
VYEGGIKIGLNASDGIPSGRGRAARIACLDLIDSSASGSELATTCGVHEDERRRMKIEKSYFNIKVVEIGNNHLWSCGGI